MDCNSQFTDLLLFGKILPQNLVVTGSEEGKSLPEKAFSSPFVFYGFLFSLSAVLDDNCGTMSSNYVGRCQGDAVNALVNNDVDADVGDPAELFSGVGRSSRSAAAAGVPRISFCFVSFFSLNWEVCCRAKLFAAVSGLCQRQKKHIEELPRGFE